MKWGPEREETRRDVPSELTGVLGVHEGSEGVAHDLLPCAKVARHAGGFGRTSRGGGRRRTRGRFRPFDLHVSGSARARRLRETTWRGRTRWIATPFLTPYEARTCSSLRTRPEKIKRWLSLGKSPFSSAMSCLSCSTVALASSVMASLRSEGPLMLTVIVDDEALSSAMISDSVGACE